MIQKSHRLSNAFQHYFIPNSEKLLSPQNIKIELWDLNTRQIENKFHPDLFCIQSIVFSKDGQQFVCMGGCTADISEFKIYSTSTLESIANFTITEQACNPIISSDSKSLYFGTWEGNFYRYDIPSGKLDCIFQLENCMIRILTTNTNREKIVLAVSPLMATKENDYILTYDLATQQNEKVDVQCVGSDCIDGIGITKNYLGYIVYRNSLFIKGSGFKTISLYLLDLHTKTIVYKKEEFQVRDTYSNFSPLSWNEDEKLAYIGLNEIFLLDTKNGYTETTIPFSRPSSVAFSNCGTAVAIGGDKAMLCKL